MNGAGQTIVVAGGAGSIGRVIVARLGALHFDVVVVGRNRAAMEKIAGANKGVRICVADLSDDGSQERVASVLSGPVRAVVHCVGVPVAGGVMQAGTDAIVQAVNLKVCGFLRLVRAADSRLVPHSRLIAIGGHYGLEPSAYAATAGVGNAALISLSRQLSLAYGPRGITSHVIAPGPVETERLAGVAGGRAAREGISVEAALEDMRKESSLGAFTTPQQVAWGVETLLAEEADALTGGTLMLDAGRRRGLP